MFAFPHFLAMMYVWAVQFFGCQPYHITITMIDGDDDDDDDYDDAADDDDADDDDDDDDVFFWTSAKQ